MACFLVPVGEAILTTAAQKMIQNKEKRSAKQKESKGSELRVVNGASKWSQRLDWLNKMLWGGSILLALEHIWHGELVPWPPFLTAMKTPGEAGAMVHEIATYGVTMAAVVTFVWAMIVVIAELRTKSKPRRETGAPVAGGGA